MSLKFIYLFFLSVSLKYILNGRIPLRVLFIMFAIDSNRLGILFHENRIGESYKKSSVSIFFSFFLPLFFKYSPNNGFNRSNGIEDRTKVWKMSTIVEILNARVSNIVTRRGGREWKGRDGKNGKIKTAFAEKGRNA